MPKEIKNCKNCEQPFFEAYEFCPHCGQKDKDELTISLLFYNTISNYFSFDARFFKSFIPLLIKPGYLARKFIEGKRLLYLHPAQMYLFISVVFFFLFQFSATEHKKSLDEVAKKENLEAPVIESIDVAKVLDSLNLKNNVLKSLKDQNLLGEEDLKNVAKLDSLIKKEAKKDNLSLDFDILKLDSLITVSAPNETIYKAMGMAEDAGSVKKKFYAQMLRFYKKRDLGSMYLTAIATIPILLFFLLPVFAFLLKIFFFKRGTYAHHLVFSFYFFSFLFTVFSLILMVNFIWQVPIPVVWILCLSTFIYLLISIKRFYDKGWFVSFIKTGFITFIYFMLIFLVAVPLLLLFSFYNY
ncbi:DUF3667 domain-containing protein [Lacinutrix jangbogonensis]|uniref:DUF3667 domain-containing protein n=1 Tax=Lacinutrix jangbogonensis TaxID=1469557 RepID=UPI00053EFED8|nr:DUF3667 domain-containing protein [Lacinutrix jangbogonensis]